LGSQDGIELTAIGEIIEGQGLVVRSSREGERKLVGMISDHFISKIEDPDDYFELLRSYRGWDDGFA
jgi:hypothetical protein